MILAGGCSSSGTTLLRSILDSHESISSGPELNIFDRPFVYKNDYSVFKNVILTARRTTVLKKGYDPVRYILDSGCVESKTQFHQGKSKKLPNLFHYVPSWDVIEGLVRENDSYDSFFSKLLSYKSKKKYVCEKSPRNAYYISDFLKLFPEGRFLYMHRNPMDNITSLFKRSFSKKSLNECIKQYIKSYTSYQFNSNDQRVLRIDYESLVMQPERIVKNICLFLNVPFDEKMLNFYKDPKQVTAGYGTTPIFTGSIGSWKVKLSNEDVEEIIDAFKRIGLLYLLEGELNER